MVRYNLTDLKDRRLDHYDRLATHLDPSRQILISEDGAQPGVHAAQAAAESARTTLACPVGHLQQLPVERSDEY